MAARRQNRGGGVIESDHLRRTFDRYRSAGIEWKQAALDLARELATARSEHPSDRAFGAWLAANGIDIDKNERAALIGLGREPDLAKRLLENTRRRSLQRIWAEATKPVSVSSPEERERKPKNTEDRLRSRRIRTIEAALRGFKTAACREALSAAGIARIEIDVKRNGAVSWKLQPYVNACGPNERIVARINLGPDLNTLMGAPSPRTKRNTAPRPALRLMQTRANSNMSQFAQGVPK